MITGNMFLSLPIDFAELNELAIKLHSPENCCSSFVPLYVCTYVHMWNFSFFICIGVYMTRYVCVCVCVWYNICHCTNISIYKYVFVWNLSTNVCLSIDFLVCLYVDVYMYVSLCAYMYMCVCVFVIVVVHVRPCKTNATRTIGMWTIPRLFVFLFLLLFLFLFYSFFRNFSFVLLCPFFIVFFRRH